MNLYECIKSGLQESSGYDLTSIANEIKQAYISGCREADMKWGGGIQREYHEPYWDFDETLDNLLVIDISWGDWKHDHRLCDNLVREVASRHGLDVQIDVDVYEEDGSDSYSARHICKFSGKYRDLEDSESFEDLDQKAKDLGITHMDYYYFVNGAKDSHSIEDANAYYDSLPDYSSVNYKKDGKDITEEQFKFLDEHRDYVSKVLHDFSVQMMNSGPLD